MATDATSVINNVVADDIVMVDVTDDECLYCTPQSGVWLSGWVYPETPRPSGRINVSRTTRIAFTYTT